MFVRYSLDVPWNFGFGFRWILFGRLSDLGFRWMLIEFPLDLCWMFVGSLGCHFTLHCDRWATLPYVTIAELLFGGDSKPTQQTLFSSGIQALSSILKFSLSPPFYNCAPIFFYENTEDKRKEKEHIGDIKRSKSVAKTRVTVTSQTSRQAPKGKGLLFHHPLPTATVGWVVPFLGVPA